MSARAGTAEHGAAVAAACTQRLRRSSDVRAAFASRAAAGTSRLVVHVRRRGDAGPARATVVAGRNVGNAVVRNRAKRRLRAALAQTPVPQGVDLVIVARQPAAVAPFAALREDLQRSLVKAVRRA